MCTESIASERTGAHISNTLSSTRQSCINKMVNNMALPNTLNVLVSPKNQSQEHGNPSNKLPDATAKLVVRLPDVDAVIGNRAGFPAYRDDLWKKLKESVNWQYYKAGYDLLPGSNKFASFKSVCKSNGESFYWNDVCWAILEPFLAHYKPLMYGLDETVRNFKMQELSAEQMAALLPVKKVLTDDDELVWELALVMET